MDSKQLTEQNQQYNLQAGFSNREMYYLCTLHFTAPRLVVFFNRDTLIISFILNSIAQQLL